MASGATQEVNDPLYHTLDVDDVMWLVERQTDKRTVDWFGGH